MRVTFNSINDGLAAINTAAARLDRAQDQVATGRRLRAASDDPAAAARAIDHRAEIGTLDAYTRAADSAAARLSAIDTLLGDIIEKISRAKATVAGARGSVVPPAAREAAARELEGLRDGILGDINTTVRGTALFAGAEAQATPYALVGGVWTYQGDQTNVAVDIGPNRSVTTALDGQAIVQGADATDLLTAVDTLIAAVRAGDQAGMDAGMQALDRAFDRAVRAQSQVGADLHGVEEEQQELSALTLASRTRLSRDEDANLAQAITEMNQAEAAYRAALGAVGTAGRLSLMDYLR
jgi:flagellar hook-associated protein 3 FlgL